MELRFYVFRDFEHELVDRMQVATVKEKEIKHGVILIKHEA